MQPYGLAHCKVWGYRIWHNAKLAPPGGSYGGGGNAVLGLRQQRVLVAQVAHVARLGCLQHLIVLETCTERYCIAEMQGAGSACSQPSSRPQYWTWACRLRCVLTASQTYSSGRPTEQDVAGVLGQKQHGDRDGVCHQTCVHHSSAAVIYCDISCSEPRCFLSVTCMGDSNLGKVVLPQHLATRGSIPCQAKQTARQWHCFSANGKS